MRKADSTERAELARFAAAQHGRIVGLLVLHTGDLAVAQELAQDTMARLVEHWPKVQRMDNPQAWLTRVALNLAASRYRRRAAERRALARMPAAAQSTTPPDPAVAIATRQALAVLTRRQRTVLILRFYEDLSVRDTAQLMDCAEGTVKSLTAKALDTLRDKHGDQLAHLRTEII